MLGAPITMTTILRNHTAGLQVLVLVVVAVRPSAICHRWIDICAQGQVAGYMVPEDATAAWSPWFLGRDAKQWQEPVTKFEPFRWDDSHPEWFSAPGDKVRTNRAERARGDCVVNLAKVHAHSVHDVQPISQPYSYGGCSRIVTLTTSVPLTDRILTRTTWPAGIRRSGTSSRSCPSGRDQGAASDDGWE